MLVAPLPIPGCVLLAVALGMRLLAGSLLFQQLDAASLLLCLFALSVIAGGIPLVNALDIASRSMTNRYLASELSVATRSVREGESFAASLRQRAVFSDVAVKMVEVGESTGALQEMLNSLAEFFEEEIETEVARFITLIEPVILIIMGAVIALVVLALYMPLFELSSVVS